MKDLKIVKLKNDDKYLILTSKVDVSTLFRKIEKILNQRNVNKSSIIVDSYLIHGNNEERFYVVSYNYKTGRIEEKVVNDFPYKEEINDKTLAFFKENKDLLSYSFNA